MLSKLSTSAAHLISNDFSLFFSFPSFIAMVSRVPRWNELLTTSQVLLLKDHQRHKNCFFCCRLFGESKVNLIPIFVIRMMKSCKGHWKVMAGSRTLILHFTTKGLRIDLADGDAQQLQLLTYNDRFIVIEVIRISKRDWVIELDWLVWGRNHCATTKHLGIRWNCKNVFHYFINFILTSHPTSSFLVQRHFRYRIYDTSLSQHLPFIARSM